MPAVSGHNADALGTVHRTAATNSHNDIALAGPVQLGAGHDFVNLGVRRNIREDSTAKTCIQQQCFNLSYPTSLRHTGVGHKKHMARSEEHTSELQSRPHLVCRLLLEKKKKTNKK